MATNVNTAFSEFLRDTINLDPNQTDIARRSKNWLIDQINSLPSNYNDFPTLVPDYHLHYGSFARKTKARPLNDIDLIIGLHAQSATHDVYPDKVIMYANSNSSVLNSLSHDDGRTINSIKVINRFVLYLSKIPQYKSAGVNRRQEAAVLDLSYSWNFDIVPCFMASGGYYIMPDGKGNWKKTDPRIDQALVQKVNQEHGGNVLNVIRIIKFWNKRRVVTTIPSYLLENIILNYYNGSVGKASSWVDVEIAPVLEYLSQAIYGQVLDPKGIQGDINTLTFADRLNVSTAASKYAQLARQARQYEGNNDSRNCIWTWREVFGDTFPSYG